MVRNGHLAGTAPCFSELLLLPASGVTLQSLNRPHEIGYQDLLSAEGADPHAAPLQRLRQRPGRTRMSGAREIAQEVGKLRGQVRALSRRQVLVIVLEGLQVPPPGGERVGAQGLYARAIGGTPEHRVAALDAIREGAALPGKDDVVWRYRRASRTFITGGLTLRGSMPRSVLVATARPAAFPG